MSAFPRLNLSWRFVRVWRRNLLVNRKTWKINFLPPLLEPFFFILAFGVGLSALVGTVSFEGERVSYTLYIAPALIAINIMQNAFFETTYASFVRMYYQKTFDAIMATPLSPQEVITAEIVWGATKALIATSIMQIVLSFMGFIHYPHGALILPLAFLGGIAFASVGMLFTAVVPAIEVFNLPIFLFITPMFLFSGTFFPVEELPAWARRVALLFPLTHLVRLTRHLCLGRLTPDLLWNVAYLAGFCVLCFPVALFAMHRRLVK